MFFNDNDFYNCLNSLKAQYEELEKENKSLRDILKSWNKNKEIQEYKAMAEEIRKNSLLVMSEKEKQAERKFRDEHYHTCAEPLHSKGKGNTYIYELTGTGLGTIIRIKCPICGEEKDITDLDNW